jgi:hypothetical protein
MRAHLLIWVLGSAFFGAYYASFGYDPGATPEMVAKSPLGLVSLAGFIAVVIAVQTLAMPVIFLLNEGRIEWQRVRTAAALWVAQGLLAVALLLVVVGVYRFAGSVSGGWPGSWCDVVVGALIGAALGLPIGLGVARLRIGERWRTLRQRADPISSPESH